MRRPFLFTLLLLASFEVRAEDRVRVVAGYTGDGRATEQWTAMVRRWESTVPTIKPLTAGEQKWADLLRSRTPQWEKEIDGLALNFAPVQVPGIASIVIGNRGGQDAFTHDPTTIGFDLSRLQAVYGDAVSDKNPAENSDRIDRFFRHEYTHLLQKAWLAKHPYRSDTPVRVALLGIWTEGLGNYYSLSQKWRSVDGKPSDLAAETLDRLAPRFVARLSALACGSSDAETLLADLSEGRFEDKWGALPAALWLENEGTLRAFVVAGPDGIWTFAERHLPEPLRATLREAQSAASLCGQ
jgi:hypothetical protein